MPMFSVTCPFCKTLLKVSGNGGSVFHCPKCKKQLKINQITHPVPTAKLASEVPTGKLACGLLTSGLEGVKYKPNFKRVKKITVFVFCGLFLIISLLGFLQFGGMGNQLAVSKKEKFVSETKIETVDVPGKASTKSTIDTEKPEIANLGNQPENSKLLKTFKNSIEMSLVKINSGSFIMGSPVDEEGRGSNEFQHRVEISKGFWLGTFEVTQGEYQRIMGNNPSKNKIGSKFPVENVSWFDSKEFCRKLSEREGVHYRLPTEAEWEFACRAGSKSIYSCGNLLNPLKANFGDAPSTIQVGISSANNWGLHDMHGNVEEWCEDWFADYISKDITDPTGPSAGLSKVVRGGHFGASAKECRSAFRRWENRSLRDTSIGFRVALVDDNENLVIAEANAKKEEIAMAEFAKKGNLEAKKKELEQATPPRVTTPLVPDPPKSPKSPSYPSIPQKVNSLKKFITHFTSVNLNLLTGSEYKAWDNKCLSLWEAYKAAPHDERNLAEEIKQLLRLYDSFPSGYSGRWIQLIERDVYSLVNRLKEL